jgi:Ca2+-transporting ATPase
MIKSSILCNNARYENFKDKYNYIGDPTEIALVENSLDLGYDKKTLVEEQPSIQKFEFDSKRKMMSILRKNKTKYTLYSKGAIEKILDVSTKEFLNGKEIMLTKKRREEILFQAKEMEKRALRVLAFAKKDFTSEKVVSEKQLTFLGFMGMIDPPRPEIKDAIKACKDAGIKIKIITGDSQVTAKAIANKIGIYGRVINEDQLEKMSDHELEKEIEDIIIFARTTPEQKLRITRILQKIGETVAITGDGVNDVLALKSADVGVAMGIRGSDVSREVADIILVDDNFASIVKGVEEGRTTYDNIKKFTKYLLAVNFSEIFLIFFSLIFGLPLPLIPLQILWMNLVSDSFPSLSLVFEKGENVMKSKPRNEKSILSGIWKFLIFAGILAFLVELIVFLIGLNKGLELEKIRTLVLTTAIMYELFFVYTCRSKKPLLNLGIFSNKWLNVAVFASLILHVIFLYCPINVFFNLVPLTLKDWLFVIPFAISGTLIFELSKYLGEKKVN